MVIGIPKETGSGETRVALTPEGVGKLKPGEQFSFLVQKGAGEKSGYPDQDYEQEAVSFVSSYKDILVQADILIMVNRPSEEDVFFMKEGAVLICQLDPFNESSLVDKLARRGILGISLEMIPRSTIAQKMDVLSSQASLAGYMAVVRSASELGKAFPMMMTPAGTISPSRVFVIGAGVAGLQAIATARRMGANVSAFDTRPVVEEQVHSLGARFIKLDLGETGQTKDGYARELTPEQLQKQRELMAKVCSQSDIVITTARVFGRKAPVIITADMVGKMKKGSLIIDMAVDSGGNVEGSAPGEIRVIDGVRILGYSKPEQDVPFHASQMFSGNVRAFLETFIDSDSGILDLEQDHEILKGCTITKGGRIVHERFIKEAQ